MTLKMCKVLKLGVKALYRVTQFVWLRLAFILPKGVVVRGMSIRATKAIQICQGHSDSPKRRVRLGLAGVSRDLAGVSVTSKV